MSSQTDRIRVAQVFPTVGKPTITYVERDNGQPELRLTASLETPGQVCLLTGPSKLGKTSLYKEVLPRIKREPLVVRCSGQLDIQNFWASALERLDFARISEKSAEWNMGAAAEIGIKGELGWAWLSKIIPGLNLKIDASGSLTSTKEFAKADLSAQHIIPLLKSLPLQLVVEDFHYLSDAVKRELFQQWKSFVDEGVSVLVISTTHKYNEMFTANPDLGGRIRVIDLSQWTTEDLAKIVEKGLKFLRLKHGIALRNYIANESAGIPIITQQICYDFVLAMDLSFSSSSLRRDYHPEHVKPHVRAVAKEFYSEFERDYDRLCEGPRSKARKYDTYSLILSAFVIDPIRFSLSKTDLIARIDQIVGSPNAVPMASLNSSLKALSAHQQRIGRSLLEWQAHTEMLHILEPTFLFYLRQRVQEDQELGVTTPNHLINLINQFGTAPYVRDNIIKRHSGPRIVQLGKKT